MRKIIVVVMILALILITSASVYSVEKEIVGTGYSNVSASIANSYFVSFPSQINLQGGKGTSAVTVSNAVLGDKTINVYCTNCDDNGEITLSKGEGLYETHIGCEIKNIELDEVITKDIPVVSFEESDMTSNEVSKDFSLKAKYDIKTSPGTYSGIMRYGFTIDD